MNSLVLQHAPFDTPPLIGEVLPFVARTITLPYMDYVALKSDASYWKAQHARVIVREEELKEQLKHKEAIIRDLNQRLYGKHSEKGGSKAEVNPNDKENKSKRSKGRVSHLNCVNSLKKNFWEEISLIGQAEKAIASLQKVNQQILASLV